MDVKITKATSLFLREEVCSVFKVNKDALVFNIIFPEIPLLVYTNIPQV